MEHEATMKIRDDQEIQVNCSCGAMWSHPEGTKTEKVLSVFESHKLYFNKPKMVTL